MQAFVKFEYEPKPMEFGVPDSITARKLVTMNSVEWVLLPNAGSGSVFLTPNDVFVGSPIPNVVSPACLFQVIGELDRAVPQKITAIRKLRDGTKWNLKACKDFVDELSRQINAIKTEAERRERRNHTCPPCKRFHEDDDYEWEPPF